MSTMLSNLPKTHPELADTIRINTMEFILPLASGAQWPTDQDSGPVLQPIEISLSFLHDTRKTAQTDDSATSLETYSLTDKLQNQLLHRASYPDLDSVAQVVCDMVVKEFPDSIDGFEVDVVQRKGSLICEAMVVSYTSYLVHGQWNISRIKHIIQGLVSSTLVGRRPRERQLRQEVRTTIEVVGDNVAHLANLPKGRNAVRQIHEAIQHSQYLTLEALASYVAKQMMAMCYDGVTPVHITVSSSQPHALPLASSAEVVMHRAPADYAEPLVYRGMYVAQPNLNASTVGATHRAILALGSNLGDRFRNIEFALRLLEIPGKVLEEGHEGAPELSKMSLTVVDTSFMYETMPMYVTDQPAFINCTCAIETNLSPLTLLRLAKAVEKIVGRVPSIRNGPRAVDVDIVFFDNLIYDTRPGTQQDFDNIDGHLVIPHPRLCEREFVLRPLNDIIPDFIHPATGQSVHEILMALEVAESQLPMHKVLPFPQLPLTEDDKPPYHSLDPIPQTATFWTHNTCPNIGFRTQLMATLNATPDSFSDGSMHNGLSAGLKYAKEAVSAGSTIIDIGGYSTRPGAAHVSVEDEINRVIPFVKAIREFTDDDDPELAAKVRHILISVDTFRPEVAEAAVLAGANCINDVYAFTGKDSYDRSEEARLKGQQIMQEMRRIARKFATPVILMHSRGDAGKNTDYSMYHYAGQKEAILEGIRAELGDKVNTAVTGPGAVRRWLVMVDPGIGFSKTVEGNLHTLRRASEITADKLIGEGENKQRNPLTGYPQLIGTSRKSFLGKILSDRQGGRETTPKERKWATAAAVVCSVQQGALVARVHDVKEMHDVVQVSDALWRT